MTGCDGGGGGGGSVLVVCSPKLFSTAQNEKLSISCIVHVVARSKLDSDRLNCEKLRKISRAHSTI